MVLPMVKSSVLRSGSFLRVSTLSHIVARSVSVLSRSTNLLCWKCTKSKFEPQRSFCSSRTVLLRRNWNCVSIGTRKMSDFTGKDKDYIFRQLLDYKSFTYTYLLADPVTKEAVLIDPVHELVERDVNLVKSLSLNLKFAINTHVHADHVTGTGEIKKRLPSCKSVITDVSGASADVKTEEGSKLDFGNFSLEVLKTPGHTNGCCTYVWHEKGMAFTGDAVLIRGCGRTDFQEGDAATLYDSVHTKIFSLPSNFLLYPAHDYSGQTVTTVAEEKTLNPRLSKSKEAFIKIMADLNLPYPKQIDRALPANLLCGVFDTK
ncbi:persulfide dioxygenase ETHE1, mitochondrial-like [Pecten maximus]|uniref:persulfide dioxygenase ETHE1, mitochondrial-like n=1 Tax=Pecten maximus TaxID=6579 RepID=UPI001458EA8E|nr:persulfide dioxygenase ETHE1, mitochondrial-like [Pecten maximus]XP_033759201.1 persulfide dioxygenase ETHE1, mitochondrial-like [Pecten maximus]